jgi:nicotinamidase-related amidase
VKSLQPKINADQQYSQTALLVVDVQQAQFHKSIPVYNAEVLLENIRTLIDCAHRSRVTVVYLQHSDHAALIKDSAGWKIHPRLQPSRADCIVHKTHGNPFDGTTLKSHLDQHKIKTLVVTGLVTHGCVRAACLAGQKHGYDVILVGDAHSSFRKDAAQLVAHWNQKLSAAGITVISTNKVEFSRLATVA